MQSLIVQLLRKALLVSIPLQYGMVCGVLEKTKQNKKQNKTKQNKKKKLHSLRSTQSEVWYNQTRLRVCVVQHITTL